MTKAQRDAYFGGAKIQCLLCGKWYRSLGTHISRIHEMPEENYKVLYGLPLYRGLTSAESRETYSDSVLARGVSACVGVAEQAALARRARVELDRPEFVERNPTGRDRNKVGQFVS